MQRAALVGLVLLGAAEARQASRQSTDRAPGKGEFHSAVGWASWYGREFHGRRTADGETFDMGALTAAHKTHAAALLRARHQSLETAARWSCASTTADRSSATG